METLKRGLNRWLVMGAMLCCVTALGCSRFSQWRNVSGSHKDHPVSFTDRAEFECKVADTLQLQNDPKCVDAYFQAARLAWRDVQRSSSAGNPNCQAHQVYQKALSSLIIEGQRFHRLDARNYLRVCTANGSINIPVEHIGFPQVPDDFDELEVVDDYCPNKLNHVYCNSGVGVPVVVTRFRRPSERFVRDEQNFAATVVLRENEVGSAIIELYDPLCVSNLGCDENELRIAKDKTAPIANVLNTTHRHRVRAFFQPGLVKPEKEGLFLLEPYQPGKIPLVLVHGLMGDTLSWSNMVNELHARPEFVDRYQLWTFEYPTAEPFLLSAAILRRHLNQLVQVLDPDGADPALRQMVFVCHSMGGLVAKMQVSESEDLIWQSISNSRFEDVKMAPSTRSRFAEIVYFRPAPYVSRIIYLGTPHNGTPLTERPVGRMSALLVRTPKEMQVEFRQLLKDNPDKFSLELSKRIPTSLDMLKPSCPMLHAINKLVVRPDVTMNSIIGTGRWMIGTGESDGIVPVASARHYQTDTEQFVDAGHAKLVDDDIVINHVLCLLREHYSQSQANHEQPAMQVAD
jgi:pimeloyl-ACP methyl ester carboxylesterase